MPALGFLQNLLTAARKPPVSDPRLVLFLFRVNIGLALILI